MRRSRLFHFSTLRLIIEAKYDSISLVAYSNETNQIMVDDLRFPKPLYFRVDKKSNEDLMKEIDLEIKANVLMGSNFNV